MLRDVSLHTEYSKEIGALGGKIVGAGGGGIFMFYVPIKSQKKFKVLY